MTTAKNLYRGAVPTSAGMVYTAPDQTRTTITKLTVTVVSGGGTTVSVWLVPRQGSNANSNEIVNTFAVPTSAGRAVELDEIEGQVLMTGEMIWMAAGSATLTTHISGIEQKDS